MKRERCYYCDRAITNTDFVRGIAEGTMIPTYTGWKEIVQHKNPKCESFKLKDLRNE